MEELIPGFIAYFVDGKMQEAEFSQGRAELPGGLNLNFELLREKDGMDIRVELTGAVELHSLSIDLPIQQGDIEQFLANGFQSWTDSRVLPADASIPNLRSPFPALMNQSGDYTFFRSTPKSGFQHSHAITWIGKDRSFHAFADQIPQTGHTIFENRQPEGILRINKDVAGLRIDGKELVLHVLTGANNPNLAFNRILKTFTPPPAKSPVTGWTSWYNYYTDIDEDIILQNLHAFTRNQLPIDIFQIDDGWQPAVGDWLTANDKFPSGMKAIADQAHAHDIQAGLWLAPFIAEQDSEVFQQHRDWFLTYDGEQLVAGGYNPLWGGAFKGRYFILDIYKDEVRSHLRRVFERVLGEWGFDMVKLDFLYAAALIPRLGRSRGAIMAEAMDFLRECCGEKTILGCGVPLGQAFGKVEYCRIGADIGLNWDTKSLKMLRHRERVSTVNSLHSTISRRILSHRTFLNDPDVFILREENNKLSPDEKHRLFVLNIALGDLVFTSDNLDEYSSETMRKYRSQFPNHPKQILEIKSQGSQHQINLRILDRYYLIASNLGDKEWEMELPDGVWFQEEAGLMETGDIVRLEKRQTKVLLRADKGKRVLGSKGHLFPGMDVIEEGGFFRRHPQAVQEGEVWWMVDDFSDLPEDHLVQKMGQYQLKGTGGEAIKYWILNTSR